MEEVEAALANKELGEQRRMLNYEIMYRKSSVGAVCDRCLDSEKLHLSRRRCNQTLLMNGNSEPDDLGYHRGPQEGDLGVWHHW